MSDNIFKGIKLNVKPIVPPTFEPPTISPELEAALEEQWKEKELEKQRVIDYQNESLELLRSINENTKGLDVVVELLKTNNKQQEEVLGLITEILAISIGDTEEVVESTYRSVMNKITSTVEDVETIQTLLGFAKTIYFLATNS